MVSLLKHSSAGTISRFSLTIMSIGVFSIRWDIIYRRARSNPS